MMLRKWEELPSFIKIENVRRYYDILNGGKFDLFVKRIFDLLVGIILLIILSPIFLILPLIIKIDSSGAILFKQERVTQFGKKFKIFKYRTMVEKNPVTGSQVNTKSNNEITKVGNFLRKYRLDEIPQLLNIISGDMTFVGTRPEVLKYVEQYTDEMKATLLLPAGLTSEASIKYKSEEQLLKGALNVDKTYIEIVLPDKMKHNLAYLENFSILSDLRIIVRTIIAVFKRNINLDEIKVKRKY
jgi:lipopolysaccharide/colanic/teichoic acid biosynthesis glycosyltransferase